jgi:hypothetical protein
VQNRGVNPLLAAVASSAESSQPAVVHRARCCRGGGEPDPGIWWNMHSPAEAGDREVHSGGEEVNAARTLGRFQNSSSQRGKVGDGEARIIVEWAVGGRSASVNDELIGEEAAAEELLTPSVAASNSSSQRQHWVEDVEVVLLLGVGSDGWPCGGWQRQTRCRWKRAATGESSGVCEEGAKWRRASSIRGLHGDKLPRHVGRL